MPDQILPPPKPYWFVTVANVVIRFAINGLGAAAAEAEIAALVPWLPLPVINWIVGTFLSDVEKEVETGADVVLIRFGGDIRQAEYDSMIKPIREKNDVTPEELAQAKAAIDKFGYHS